jgi:hypothetical protein
VSDVVLSTVFLSSFCELVIHLRVDRSNFEYLNQYFKHRTTNTKKIVELSFPEAKVNIALPMLGYSNTARTKVAKCPKPFDSWLKFTSTGLLENLRVKIGVGAKTY